MVSCSEEPNRNAFQMPLLLTEAGAEVEQWPTVSEPEEVIVGLRKEARDLISENKYGKTLK